MKIRGSKLFRTFVTTLESTQPQFFRLTDDRFWVAKSELLDGGETVLTLHGFDVDDNEVVCRELCRTGAEESEPYCQLTARAVVLLHAPEDPEDRKEDKALTVRCFPYDKARDTLVWRIEPEELPGLMIGIDKHWSEEKGIILWASFRDTDGEPFRAQLKLEPEEHRLTVLQRAAFGAEADTSPPGPDPEKLIIDKDLIELINYSVTLPNGTYIQLTAAKADERRCEVRFSSIASQSAYDIDAQEGSVSGFHHDFFFPTSVEGYPVIFDLESGRIYSGLDIRRPFSKEEKMFGGRFLRLSEDGILEADRSFADAYLSQRCRDEARYADERCYRWKWWDNGSGIIVAYELPAFFLDLEYETLAKFIAIRCRSYLRAMNINNWKNFRCGYEKNRAASKALVQKLSEELADNAPAAEE